MALALVVGLGVTTQNASVASAAVLPVLPASTQFDITGFLQVATLDATCVTNAGATLDAKGFPQVAHCGGTMVVNNHTIVVPAETIAVLPASALTWQELFAQAPAPYGPTQTGLALADLPKPLTTYEINVVGNRVLDPGNATPANRDRYIAGLVHISQQDLNTGAGYINFMNYTTGEMEVGGVLGVAGTGARVQVNDPLSATSAVGGRYGRAMTPDPRFMVDQDNPTIASATGFPMCFPRTDPAVADDALCPVTNRPTDVPNGTFLSTVMMTDPAFLPLGGALDPRVQAPMEVGDYVIYAGTLTADAAGTYISAHTIDENTAIFTAPGTNPAYIKIDVSILGTGGVNALGIGEATVRTRFEGMSTDTTRRIHLYGIDVNPNGTTSDRDWGTIFPDVSLANGGAAPGRWRFRPGCLTFGTAPAANRLAKECVYGPGDQFLPATREVRAVIEGLQTQDPANPAAVTSANGIYYGQYHAPIDEFLFPENVPGAPIPENNFNTMPFLAQGGYSSFTGVVAGVLNPWPSNIPPAVTCVAPVANAGGPYTVGSGGTVSLAATTTGTNPAFVWTTPPVGSGSLSTLVAANPVYTAPVTLTPKVVTLTLTVSNGCGTSIKTATVNVLPAVAPTVSPVPAQSVFSGDLGTINLTGADTNAPPSTPLTFTVTQTGAPALTGVSVTQNGLTGAIFHYTAPPAVVAPPKVITLSIHATNAAGVSSPIVTTTVTINPAVVVSPPAPNAGGPYTVNSGSTVTLAGSAGGTVPLTFLWTAPPVGSGSLSSLNVASPVYRAPVVGVDTIVTLTLSAKNVVSTVTATATVTVKAALPPTVAPVPAISVFSGANGTFTVTGTDPNTPALTPLTFHLVAPTAPFTAVTVTNPQPTSARINFTAPILAVGAPASVQHLTITATNAGLNQVSANQVVTITVLPVPDQVTITNAEYRIGQQRLIIAASSSVISPTVTLSLLPYQVLTPVPPLNLTTFTPTPGTELLTNIGGGLYTLTLVGAPQPAAGAVLQVQSSLGGSSPLHALDRLRQ
jgi:hypothetical protein